MYLLLHFIMDEENVEKMVVEFPPLGSLLGSKYQSSQCACHKASIFVTGLHHRGQLLVGALRLELMIWSRVARFFEGDDHSKESDSHFI